MIAYRSATLALMLTLASSLALAADTVKRYVAAERPAELRSGLGPKDTVIQTLAPGTEVTLLKQNTKLGYSRVQTATGDSGWVDSRALTPTAAAAPTPLVTPEPTATPPSTEALQAEISHLQTELIAIRQASSNILRIQAERDQLQETVITLKKELDTAEREKNALNDDQKQGWFVIGSTVLFGGIVLGLLIPRLSLRRRNSWNTF